VSIGQVQAALTRLAWCAGVSFGAQVDPLVVFVGVVSELSWGCFGGCMKLGAGLSLSWKVAWGD
jgi:hypothetical protein